MSTPLLLTGTPDSDERGVAPAEGTRGFTLIELVLAVAIIGGAFLSLLWMRTAAVSRAGDFMRGRLVQRLAQEKLDEVMFGIETEDQGTFEVSGFREFSWQVEVLNVGTLDVPLFACTVTLRWLDPNDEEQDFTLSTWILNTAEESLLQNLIDSSVDGTRP